MDSKLVRIYHRGQLIKTHVRQPRGGRATDPEDYPAHLSAYTTRAPDGIKSKAAELGPAVASASVTRQSAWTPPAVGPWTSTSLTCGVWSASWCRLWRKRPRPKHPCRCPRGASPDPAASLPEATNTAARHEEIDMTLTTDLTPLLKRLQLGPMAATLPERIALARRKQLDYASFLEIILADEVNRRAHRRTEMRLQQAGFQEICRLEDFDWSASITLNRRLLDAAFSLEFLSRHEHVLLVGPAGVGKSFMAQALGYAAVRAGHTVRFSHADDYFRVMNQARVDNSLERTFRTFLSPDLLILDDLGLHRFTAQQSADLYELILNRHRASSFVITSNRAVDEWLGLFEDPIHGNSALDRLANASYQIVIEGSSYRERLSPHRALLEAKGGA